MRLFFWLTDFEALKINKLNGKRGFIPYTWI